MIQQTVQVILSCIWVLLASPIAGKITPEGWYYLGAGLSGVQLILSIFFLPETKYKRPLEAYQENTDSKSSSSDPEGTNKGPAPFSKHASTERSPLDFINYAPRTLRSDMRLWVGKPQWSPNIGQIVTAVAALPLLGYGSDMIIKYMAKRNNGIHEPESRLIPLIIPIVIGTFTAVLYGQAAQHPENYQWFTIVWGIAAYYFTFVGANIVAITYLLDSYPAPGGPHLGQYMCVSRHHIFRNFLRRGAFY